MSGTGLDERGLDPAHILSVANLAITDVARSPVHAVASADSVRVCLSSRRAASAAARALTQVGYQVQRIRRTGKRDVRVTGWSATGLESRLAALRTVIYQLQTSPSRTAAAVIDRVRQQPVSALVDAEALAEVSTRLWAFVYTRSGIHAPHNPAILPTDLDNALRLRAAWQLESAIDRLIARHIRVTARALRIFRSLGQHDARAQTGRPALYLIGGTSSDESPRRSASGSATRRASRTPGQSPRFSRPAPAGERPGGAARPAARPGGPARPGGRNFPTGRPGRRRH